MFFHHKPQNAVLSDLNERLVDTYRAIKQDYKSVDKILAGHQVSHGRDFYYQMRAQVFTDLFERAAQFLYLNRACWNGLYRENLQGKFNVPIGTKSNIVLDGDDFAQASEVLQNSTINCSDFQETVNLAESGDLLFVDPPYTTAHNLNGFVKYNQKMFSWDDQKRLSKCLIEAKKRNAKIILTNAAHESIKELYKELGAPIELNRKSIISGKATSRTKTSELLYVV